MIPIIGLSDPDSLRVLIDAQVACYRKGEPAELRAACRAAYDKGVRADSPEAQLIVRAAAPLVCRATRWGATRAESDELGFLARIAGHLDADTSREVVAALDEYAAPIGVDARDRLRAACVERLRREPAAGVPLPTAGRSGRE